MDIKKIKQLIDLLKQSEVAEIELKEQDTSIRIINASKASGVSAQSVLGNSVFYDSAHVTPVHHPLPALTPSPIKGTPNSENSLPVVEGEAVASPMVGTFYRSSGPKAKPFVEEGQEVKTGDTICIIEAMKTFNQIKAERNGIIAKILVEDGEPVEYGQSLFLIK